MKRSKFNLSNTQLLSADMGQLIPCGLLEVLPGDTIQHAASILARCMPLSSPPMHRVRIKLHHWFVPHRLVWSSWENFITGGADGLNASVFPTISLTNVAAKSLADYLGVPVGNGTQVVSALPFRGYALIWNQWYRDQDLQTPLTISLADGADTTTSTVLQSPAWEKDYFTTARPWEQKGSTVQVASAISGIAANVQQSATSTPTIFQPGSGDTAAGNWKASNDYQQSPLLRMNAGGTALDLKLIADINDFREAFALQRYKEARARYGSRYTEYLAYLGVRSSDARLQRPEYLGGSSQNISFSEVLQTGSTTADVNGVGQLYGHGIAAMRSNRYRKFFEEHGYIHSFISVMPESMYPNGIFRTWNRRTKEDFFQKELQHIGQQPVLMKEVYALGANPDSVFGYQDRYDDYRYQESRVHGEFLTTLNDWHFARLLGAQPALNAAFVSGADVTKRPFQAQGSNNTMLFQVRHKIGARRIVAARGSSFVY